VGEELEGGARYACKKPEAFSKAVTGSPLINNPKSFNPVKEVFFWYGKMLVKGKVFFTK
jgi:hypothetical protein